VKRAAVVVSAAACRIIRHLHPDAKRAVRKALDSLSINPSLGKPLQEELAGLWSLPVANHRIIYQIAPGTITVVFIGPRHDVYQRLRELLSEK
jgi:mRNA-degrading endonuclease RelE of RelBE toxin-antitoxin system